MGHEKISVLDGGLPRWLHEGYEVENNAVESEVPSSVEVCGATKCWWSC